MQFAVHPGDVSAPGTLTATPASGLPSPSLAGFTPAGSPVEVGVGAALNRPLTLSMTAGAAHPGDLPVVLHLDPTNAGAGWTVAAVGPPGGVATAARDRFSPYLPGWLNPAAWGQWLLAEANSYFRGRYPSPSCGTPAPPWFSLTEPQLDLLHACSHDTSDSKGPRAEVRLTNNRGLVQQVIPPASADYVWVDKQPQWLRDLTSSITGAGTILLEPGQQMTIGMRRPNTDGTVSIDPQNNGLSLGISLLEVALGGTDEDNLATGLLTLSTCSGIHAAELSRQVPDTRDALTSVAKAAWTCLVDFAKTDTGAVDLAGKVLSRVTGRTALELQSDRELAPSLDALAGKIKVAGQALAAIDLAVTAYKIWDNVGDQLGRLASGDNDPAVVTIGLRAAASASGEQNPLTVLAHLGYQQCLQNGDPQAPCPGPTAANPVISTVDPRYGFAGPAREGYGGSVFMRSSPTSADFRVAQSIGGGVASCEQQPVPAPVLRGFNACFDDPNNPSPTASNGHPSSNPRQFLQQFLAVWQSGDTATEASYASAAALADFPTDPANYTRADLVWSDDCLQGSSGGGGCSISLTARSGNLTNFLVTYHSSNEGATLIIDSFQRQ